MLPNIDEALTFDKADRLRRALRVSGISVNDMADYLEVSRNTVTTWINGRHEPRRRDLAAFALRTGFPLEWLETGNAPRPGGGGGQMLPHLDSNQKPAGFEPVESRIVPLFRENKADHSQIAA